jgi:hypothetical protein
MGTLSALDETKPLNVDPLAQGDDAIRETRLAIKTTFAVEHNLDGTHYIPSGATRPGGTAGSLFINTGTQRIECYAGGTWLTVPPVTYERVYENQVPYVVVFPVPKTLFLFRRPGTMTVTVEPTAPNPLGNLAYYQFANITKLTISAMSASGNYPVYIMMI